MKIPPQPLFLTGILIVLGAGGYALWCEPSTETLTERAMTNHHSMLEAPVQQVREKTLGHSIPQLTLPVPATKAFMAKTNTLPKPMAVASMAQPSQGQILANLVTSAATYQVSLSSVQSINPSSAPTGTFTPRQQAALANLLNLAGAISQALASDDLTQFNKYAGQLPGLLPALHLEFAALKSWQMLIQRLGTLREWSPAKDLTEARKRFLPFSIIVVELAKRAKKESPTFSTLKLYKCPMAPAPGVWIQSKGPLRNPYYGAKMLTCGVELKP